MIKTHWDRTGCHRDGADGGDARRTSTHRAPNRPLGMKKQRRLTHVLAGQAPYDLARPKGFEPLTF